MKKYVAIRVTWNTLPREAVRWLDNNLRMQTETRCAQGEALLLLNLPKSVLLLKGCFCLTASSNSCLPGTSLALWSCQGQKEPYHTPNISIAIRWGPDRQGLSDPGTCLLWPGTCRPLQELQPELRVTHIDWSQNRTGRRATIVLMLGGGKGESPHLPSVPCYSDTDFHSSHTAELLSYREVSVHCN